MSENTAQQAKYIRLAAMVALSGNAVLATMKIIAGFISQSVALVGDGIDSSTDVLISVMTLVVVTILAKPADTQHPWGHGRAETIATAGLSFVIFFAGAQLIFNALANLWADIHTPVPSMVTVIVLLISIIGKILLAFNQYMLGKRANSAMIMANAKNMAADVLISLGVLAGFGIAYLTGSGHADGIMAVLIGAWVIKTALDIFRETYLELMDGNNDMEHYQIIVEAVNAVEGASNPHRARMRRIAGFWDIDLDINVDPHITVSEAHKIASRVEREIKKRLGDVYDIVIHIEPCGDDAAEAFGLSEAEMDKRGEKVVAG
ncbi:MAG: cation diffusion facilitator family transporter [Symbiobacteriaceae bacterium]|nr:cation diffusion facilitator family transporter [Symbiobacteriaceae bacterium]